jgi:hypothetical protein
VSLILALLTSRDGIVASDGRRFGNAVLENRKVVKPAPIESEKFDKTFSLDGGRVVGAFAGLMCFSGKEIAEHIDESLQALATVETDFVGVAKRSCYDPVLLVRIAVDIRKLLLVAPRHGGSCVN